MSLQIGAKYAYSKFDENQLSRLAVIMRQNVKRLNKNHRNIQTVHSIVVYNITYIQMGLPCKKFSCISKSYF